MRHRASRPLALLDVFARPERVEVRAGVEGEVLTLDQRLGKVDRIVGDADVRPDVPVAHPMLDGGGFVTGRKVLAAVPALLDVRRDDGQHVALPDAGRETHPRVWC